jgi:hypothetical protein
MNDAALVARQGGKKPREFGGTVRGMGRLVPPFPPLPTLNETAAEFLFNL